MAVARWRDAGCSGRPASRSVRCGAGCHRHLRWRQSEKSLDTELRPFLAKKLASKQRTRALCLQPRGCHRAFFPPPGRHLHRIRPRENATPPPFSPPPPTNPDLSRRPQISVFLAASSVGYQADLSTWRPGVTRLVSFPCTFIRPPRDGGRRRMRAGQASSLSCWHTETSDDPVVALAAVWLSLLFFALSTVFSPPVSK